ncbi:MAG: chemotaxis protein CheW [Planctomycetaceae bacterium]|nr:chemotaxis protein CheW [Planctomycetaceae bacterium]
MNATLEAAAPVRSGDVEFVTFCVGDLLLGAEICHVEEINRHVDVTPVAHSPEWVLGVVNLRGEVVTVLDLRWILGLGNNVTTATTRNVVVNAGGERIGFLVDRIADVVNASWSDIKAPPANLNGAQGRFLQGIYELDHGLLAVLNMEEVLAGN